MTKAHTKKRGYLIAFEGIDGTGKSTQVAMLAEALRRQGRTVATTREPTDGPFGQRIRQLYQNRDLVSREEELALFLADRRQHVDELIRPELARGKVVLTDRYYFSTVAYQGAAGCDPLEILRQNEVFAPVPDLVILCVLPPEEAVRRIQLYRGEELNHFEQEEGLRRVDRVFRGLTADFIRRVDASGAAAAVHDEVLTLVGALLAEG